MAKLLNVSSSPHVRTKVSTKNIMYDVAIAMVPALIWGVMQFGIRSLIVVAATVASCMLSEYAFEKIMKKPITIGDGSALVTGIICCNPLHCHRRPSPRPSHRAATGSPRNPATLRAARTACISAI